VVGAPAIQDSFAASYAGLAGAILLVPGLLGLVLDPVLFLLADRYPRRRFLVGGLLVMAGCALVAALAPSLVVLSAAMSVAFLASGAATPIAEATLVDARPDAREEVLTRWTLFGLAGDLAAPLLFAVLAWLALDWRAGYAVVGAVALLLALALLRRPTLPRAAAADDEGGGLFSSLRVALGNRTLLLWLGGTALCDLLDEILVIFASLHLRDTLGLGPVARGAILAGFVAGGALGLLAVERLLRRAPPVRVLFASSVACAALYLHWLSVSAPVPSALLFAAVGATAAPLYPLAMAQAYAALPGRSGAVNAAASLFAPLQIAAPLAIGAAADAHGATVALVFLAVQPIGLALISAYSSTGRPR
jgi:predicted MFS family arabinose efflux permease